MEPEARSPCSHEPATRLYPEPDEFSTPLQYYFFKIHFSIIFPSTLGCS
jgi:hypothetical protein